MKKISFVSLLLLVTLFGFCSASFAAYPNKPVSFVIPFPPGDLEDILTRLIADEFQSMYKSPAAVINKPGGGGGPFPGALSVAQDPADGYTIGSFTKAIPVISPYIGIEGLKEDTFESIGIFLTYPFVIATKKGNPYKTMKELAAFAQNNKVSLGHFGAKAIPTRVTKALALQLGFKFALDSGFDELNCNTMVSGDADVINTTLQQVFPCLDTIQVLASVTMKRIPVTSYAPTVGELVPDLKTVLWNGLFVKKGTPKEAKEKVEAAAIRALKSPKALKLAADTGAEIYWMNAQESDALILADREDMKKLNKMLQ